MLPPRSLLAPLSLARALPRGARRQRRLPWRPAGERQSIAWSLPDTRGRKEKAVDKATWVGGDEEGGRRKDGRLWRGGPEVTEVSPAPRILPLGTSLPLFRLLPAGAAAAAPESRPPPAQDNAMADAGRSLHPSARRRGRTGRRTLRLLRLLLWVGTAFQVTQGAEPELHACKEVPSSRTRPHFGQKHLGSWWRRWGPRHRQFQRPRSLVLGG